MRRCLLLCWLLAFTLLWTGCGRKNETERASPDSLQVPAPSQPHVDGLPDSVKMNLIDRIQFGASYDEVRQQLDQAGPLQPKGIANLAESTAPVRVLGQNAVLELNFQGVSLYSFYYRLESVPCNRADSLYRVVQAHYTRPYGTPEVENNRDGSYTAHSSFWRAETFDVVATRGEQSGQCRLVWGFQEK